MAGDENMELVLSDGRILRAKRHRDWGPETQLEGICFDLASAYKQLAVHPEVRWLTVFSVFDLSFENSVAWYVGNALAFGAMANVLQFNRTAAAVRQVLTKCLGIHTVHYFDDYPVIVPAEIAASIEDAMSGFTKITGWK